MRKTFKYRIYPTPKQEKILDHWLYLCRQLYNTCLEQRQIAYKQGKKVSKYDQMRELPTLKKEIPEYRTVGSQVLQDVIDRLEKSFQRFFNGGGYPKFQGRNRYSSLTFKQAGWKIENGRLYLTGCGAIKVKWSREIQGDIKTVTIKRTKTDKWFVCFSCDNVPPTQYPATTARVGIDLGISALATTSDGEKFENARYLKAKLKQLRRLQRQLARQKNKQSKRRQKTIRRIQRLHEKIANQRRDAHHKASTSLVRRYALIVHEDISPQFMLRNRRLAREAADVGWAQFLTFLQRKAAAAGRKVVAVNPANTSQLCSGCGQIVPKKLSDRWHLCPHCGTSLDRDHNAAINILRLAG